MYRLEVFEGDSCLLYRRHIRANGDAEAIKHADAFYDVAAVSILLHHFVLYEGLRVVHQR